MTLTWLLSKSSLFSADRPNNKVANDGYDN
jgi:hypothetical protein